jgi:hypothetical protein
MASRLFRAPAYAFAAVVAVACILHAEPARADITSFLSMGGGMELARNRVANTTDSAGSMSFAMGVGTDPFRKVVLAGMFRSTTSFTLGTDLNIAARVATGGFARGQWGVALDVGPGWRSFAHGQYGKWPLFGQVTFGAPWGLQLGAGAQVLKLGGDDPTAVSFLAVLEVDLLRLTIMRQGSTDKWWPNPSPAGGKYTGFLPGLVW